MTFIDIVVLILVIIIVVVLIIYLILEMRKGPCASCAKGNKKSKLLKEYRKKYQKNCKCE